MILIGAAILLIGILSLAIHHFAIAAWEKLAAYISLTMFFALLAGWINLMLNTM